MRKYTILILVLLLCLCITPVHAAEEHSHCVCGGYAVGVQDHQKCEDVVWQPLSSVVDLKHVDWKNVPSGYYYLDGNIRHR